MTIANAVNANITFPASGTLYGTASGSITSSQLATSLSDEVGTGSCMFQTSSTWSPTVGDGTNNFTLSTADGSYYKFGDLYYICIRAIWTSKGAAAGELRVSVPFTAAMTRNAMVAGYTAGITATNYAAMLDTGRAYIVLTTNNGTGTMTTVGTAACAAAGEIVITGVCR